MAMNNNYYSNMNNGYPYINRPTYEAAAAPSLKGRPVTSFEEVRASMIDFDGSVSYFPDQANKKIYTKQINMDGTPQFKVYQLVEQPQELNFYSGPAQIDTVTREDFNKTVDALAAEIEALKNQLKSFSSSVPEKNYNF